jgi:hypothetical protein
MIHIFTTWPSRSGLSVIRYDIWNWKSSSSCCFLQIIWNGETFCSGFCCCWFQIHHRVFHFPFLAFDHEMAKYTSYFEVNWCLRLRTLNTEIVSARIRHRVYTLSPESYISHGILSYVWVIKMGFGLVILFTGYLQVVTTNNYNTVTDFHTTKHSTIISSVYLH